MEEDIITFFVESKNALILFPYRCSSFKIGLVITILGFGFFTLVRGVPLFFNFFYCSLVNKINQKKIKNDNYDFLRDF